MQDLSQGTLNNLKGLDAETEILNTALALGFKAKKRVTTPDGIARGTTISCLIDSCRIFPGGLAILAFGQESSGSGADKIVYKVWNAVEGLSTPSIIVIYGDGRGMEDMFIWARAQVGRQWHKTADCSKLRAVIRLEELEQWLSDKKATGKAVKEPDRYAIPLIQQLSLIG